MIWDFLTDPANRETIAWLAGGAATAIGGLWTAYLTLRKPAKSAKPEPAQPTAAATGRDGLTAAGDVLIEGDVTLNTPSRKLPVTIGALGLLALGYAAFFAPSGDCIAGGIKSGGDIQGGSIIINAQGANVDC